MTRISDLAALASPDPADLLAIVDVSDTSMAPTGTTKKITAGTLPCLQVFPITNYGAVGDGTTNCTAAITAAKTAAGAGSRNIILIPPGTFMTDPFTFDGFHWLGYGPYASILKARSGSLDFATNTGYANGSVPTNGSETSTVIEGICFDGSNLSGTNAGNLYGSSHAGSVGGSPAGAPTVVAVGNGAPSGTFGAGIPTFIIRDCMVRSGPGIGISTAYARGGLPDCHYTDVFVRDCGGHGWHLGSDSRLIDCTSENNGQGAGSGAGFYANGSSSYSVVGCKAYSGLGSSGYGFRIGGQTNGASYSGCLAQDNTAGGIFFESAQGYTVTGLCCDSNGALNAGSAVIFSSSTGNYVEYIAIDRSYNGGSGGTDQRYALNIDTGSTGNTICVPQLSQNNSNGSITSTVAWLASGSGNGAGNDIKFGSYEGAQFPAFAASYTPDPTLGRVVTVGTLTAAITVNAPSPAWAGARLDFRFTQDGTGGRTVAWNAAFVFQSAWTNTGNTAGKRSTASFYYDGTNWVSLSPAANAWF